MRAKPYVTGNTQVCVKQLTLAYEQPHKTKAPLPKGRFPPLSGENVGVADKKGAASRRARLSERMRGLGDSYKKNINFDNPSVICFANATSLYTREAMER